MDFYFTRKIFLTVIMGITIFPLSGYAYETITHEALTHEIVDFFNTSSSLKLTPREQELMTQGSIEEDDPSRRVLNHFYDPVRNIGLNDGHSAKEWAVSETIQEYSVAGGGNYSWPQILKDYAGGNEEQAFRGLGHILHLIEDMATPDHTRNDSHLTINILGFSVHLNTNPSPYEEWAAQKTKSVIQSLGEDLFAPGVEMYTFSNLGEAFDKMAGYANGNFFSKDTIMGDKYSNFVYENPKITEFDESYGYGVDKLSSQPQKLIILTQKDGKVNFQLSTEDDNSVLEDYFARLSKQTIIVGAGVIDLFFREAEAARSHYLRVQAIKQEEEMRQNEELQRRLESANVFERIALGFQYMFIDPIASSVKNTAQWAGSGVVTVLRMDAQFQVNKYAMMNFTRNLLGNLASTFARETINEVQQDITQGKIYIQERITSLASKLVAIVSAEQHVSSRNNDKNVSLQNLEAQVAVLQEEIETVRRGHEVERIRIQTENSVQVSIPTPTFSSPPTPSPPPLLGSIDSRSFSGQFSNSPPEPVPNRAPEPLPNRAPKPASSSLETTTPSSFLNPEETTPALPSPSKSQEPSPDSPPASTVMPEPESFPDPEDSETPTPTAEPSPEPPSSESPTPEPSPAPEEFFPGDVVINEIAWMGTRQQNSQDEWIELYNTTDRPINLNGWKIESPGRLIIEFTADYQEGVKSASWTEAHTPVIAPFSYFLLERTDDATTSEAANWFFKGNLPNADSKKPAEERNKKEGLVLKYQDREIDNVSRWYAGSTDDGYRTMERISPFQEGDDSENWNDNDGVAIHGLSAGDGSAPPTPILGTPGKENSVAGNEPGQV